MSAEYSRDNCKIAVAKILQTIGWHSINSTPLEVLTDILTNYVSQIAKICTDYASEFGQTEPNLDHLGLAFQEMGVNLSELEEYVTFVDFVPPANPVPKFPLPKESNLNFLKPGSKEVVTRPIHINEHLPPMYPLLEEQHEQPSEASPVKKEIIENEGPDNHQFKKPADVVSPEFKRLKREEEGGRPTREISSVMMTTSGFLSPAREGKLPEAKAPAPPPEPPKPPSPAPPVPELVSAKKKPEKKREKVGKELFRAILEEKTPKKINNMKDILTMKRAKAVAANAMAPASMAPPGLGGMQSLPPAHFMSSSFPGDVKLPPLIAHTHKPQVVKPSNFNKALAAAKAKTEKLNTTITPIPVKSESKFQIPVHHHIDKLVSEPDRKKINILKKISSSRDKHEKAKTNLNAQLMQQAQDIVSKINLSSDITIEPINPALQVHKQPVKMESFFDGGSPPPRTPEMLMQTSPFGVKEKRKRKEKSDKPRVKRPRKQPFTHHPHFLDSELLDMTMNRPKTPDAHLLSRKNNPFSALPVHTAPGLPFPFPLANFGGPGLIPPLSSPLFPFTSPLPDFGKNPYFQNMPPKPEPAPKMSPKPKELVKSEPVEIVPLPAPATPPPSAPAPERIPSPPPTAPTPPAAAPMADLPSVKVEENDGPVQGSSAKKSKEHKKDKKDKTKKKNKKEKVKDKTEKKKLKEAKKEKVKIKKEKKKKLPKEEPQVDVPAIPKILLKVNEPSSRPQTPDTMKKLNIKPIVKKEETSPERKQREPSPGLAQISALVVGPPKPKNPPAAAPPDKPVAETPTVPVPPPSRPPGRPRIHPLKQKPTPKPKKVEQPFVKRDADGNEVWICPACGQQDDGRPMIGCDGCDAWYHWVCVGIQVPPDENENWYCKPCLAKKNEDLQDKKKKRKKKDKNH